MSATGLARSTDRQRPTDHPSAGVHSSAERSAEEPATRINRVALVSHDYNLCNAEGYYDYSEHFSRINRLCDENGCDTILYSPYTWDEHSPVPCTRHALFDG